MKVEPTDKVLLSKKKLVNVKEHMENETTEYLVLSADPECT